MKTPALLGVLLMFGGCAHFERFASFFKKADPASDPAAAVAATERQLAQHETAMSAPKVAARGKQDCTRARALRDDVCTLGQRVCLLVDGDRAIPQGEARCKKANLQCEKASTHMTGTCRKPSKARYSRR
jgi:hypothetical protein